MRLTEHEAKEIFKEYGIPIPFGVLIKKIDNINKKIEMSYTYPSPQYEYPNPYHN